MPEDRFKVVLLITCLLGIASLLPWNVLITQAEFLLVRSHQPPYNKWLADQFISLTANAYLLMNVAAFLLLLPLGRYISLQTQIVIPFLVSAIVVIIQAWVAYNTQLSGNTVIVVTLLSSGLLGWVTAAMTSATYALATYLPSVYIQALLLGQSLAGVATSVLSFLTIWRTGSQTQAKPTSEDVKSAAIQYFLACALIEILGVAGFFLIPHSPFVQHWIVGQGSVQKVRPNAADSESDRLQIEAVSPPRELSTKVRRLLQKPSAHGVAVQLFMPFLLNPPVGIEAFIVILVWTHILALIQSVENSDAGDVSVRELAKKLRGAHYLVGSAFLVSLAAFPAVVSMICSVKNEAKTAPCFARPSAGRFYGNLFQPFIFLLFNFGDAVGRLLPGFHRDTYSPVVLFPYAGARVLLVVGIMLCNIVGNSGWRLPHALWSDWWSTLLVLLLGVTNGHLATIAFMHAPRFVAQQYRDRVGTIMSFCLTLGLGLGSIASMLLLWWLQS